MVRIFLILFCLPIICFGQTEQAFYGRTLDSAAILNSDIADSSINFNKLMYVNGPKLIGNPSSAYDSLKCIKLGTNLAFSNDTLNASGASGNVNQNGNSFGATMVLGSNDNNTLELETNGVSRLGITSGATTGGELTSTSITTNTSTLSNALTIRTNSTGTAAAGFGGGILFQGESNTTDNKNAGRIAPVWTNATNGSEVSDLVFGVAAGGSIIDYVKIRGLFGDIFVGSTNQAAYKSGGITTQQAFTVGNSSSALTLGGSSGTVSLTSSANSTNAVLIQCSHANGNLVLDHNASGSAQTEGICLGNPGGSAWTQTSGTRNMVRFPLGFAPTSGTAVHNSLAFVNTFNQTGGANGITRNIYLNSTLTAVADFRAIESTYNTANAWHIYQTGSSSKGNSLLKTSIGTTTAATSLLMLAAGTASANTAPLKFTSGTNLTTAEAGAVEYDGSNLYFTNAAPIRFTVAKLLSGTATLDFGNTAAGTSDDLTVTITGAADGDEIVLGVPNAAMSASSSYFAWVSATNTVTIRHNNYSTGSIDPASASFKVSVIKR